MKTTLVAAGLGGLITTAAAAGPAALTSLGVLLLAAIGTACWIVADRSRTANAVAIITASRGNLHIVKQRLDCAAPEYGPDTAHQARLRPLRLVTLTAWCGAASCTWLVWGRSCVR